jgi:hypothetical protein
LLFCFSHGCNAVVPQVSESPSRLHQQVLNNRPQAKRRKES